MIGRRARTAALAAGVAGAAVAVAPPIDAVADPTLAGHMLQHMLLTMAAAPLIVIGSPIAVALRRTPPGARRALAGFGRGRAAHLITSPTLGWALLPALQIVVYTTPLLGLSAQNDAVHAAVHAALLGAALLFWRPVLGADPIRRLAPLAQVGLPARGDAGKRCRRRVAGCVGRRPLPGNRDDRPRRPARGPARSCSPARSCWGQRRCDARGGG